MIRDQELAGLAMTLGRDAKIKITVSGDTSFCSPDGSHINIARMPSTPLGRMLAAGLVFHEVGHKNYTKGGRPDGLLGDMMNVIEDVRVDMETIKTRPGTCFNLEAVTTYYVNKGSLEPTSLAHAMLGKVMSYGFGRLMNHKAILPQETLCNEMMDDAFGQEFIEEVEVIIKDIPKLRSTRDTTVMAQKLIDLLVQQQTPPSRPAQKQLQGQEQNVKQGSNGGGSSGGKRPTPEEIEVLLKNNTGYGDFSTLIQKELDSMSDSIPDDIREGIPMLPVIGKLKASHGKMDEVEAISASSRMRARMMGLLQSIKRQPKSYGLSGRKLAPGRLVKLATGDPRIFRKKIEKVEVNTAVILLLDLSGSMTSKYEIANAATFALHTTLFGLKGVAVCSVEFSGKDKEPEVNILVDFGRKPQSENFNHRPFDSTPTHNAIWAGRAMLLQRPEPRKIMLLLTDGCPDNKPETRGATQRTMKDGIEVAAIGIMDKNVRRFWDNHKIIETIQELPVAMFGIMEGLLIKR
ncbi:VWA domain-containing protein [Pelobacter propionicus]|uniref:von Willebrand factor, type A n=1 Tax=Pelobacter propionicus (strain DSM 2379 / NBRC 103807 / OttBd1) TaxID=338966 RepID=A1AQ81_PELPD|nr:VWA domain-containing protein [Pelobacter propionicus]ABK99501.1 von Willebrand factor, type A [Pelobacter propionicus DSM 2379]